eukprot:444582-Alexandrium_andersonii.AAC.1
MANSQKPAGCPRTGNVRFTRGMPFQASNGWPTYKPHPRFCHSAAGNDQTRPEFHTANVKHAALHFS